MKHVPLPRIAALILALVGPLPALAQIDLTALSLQARAHDTLVSWQERAYRPAGLVEIVNVPGHLIVDVRAVFDGPWSETVERVQVNTADIRLILPDGRELEPVGAHPYWGQATLQTRTMSGRRPRNFPTDDADLHWNGLFRVPKGVTSATLRLGGSDVRFAGEVTIPAPSVPEDAASFASFRVTGVRRFRTITLETGRGEAEVTSSLTAPPGQVLAELVVEITAIASNQVDGDDRFSWNTHNFRLVDDQGQTLGLAGERFMDRLLDSQFNGAEVGRDADRTMVFVAPESLSEARLLFGETEIARVALGAAPVTEVD